MLGPQFHELIREHLNHSQHRAMQLVKETPALGDRANEHHRLGVSQSVFAGHDALDAGDYAGAVDNAGRASHHLSHLIKQQHHIRHGEWPEGPVL